MVLASGKDLNIAGISHWTDMLRFSTWRTNSATQTGSTKDLITTGSTNLSLESLEKRKLSGCRH
jgi:hypothetical protein